VKVGELIAGRYELEELVGEGGMSSVYRAHDVVLERRVALKILHEHFSHDAEYVERFRREARAIARLAHPNVVTVIDRGEWKGRQFIVFEHVEGETLKEVVVREGPLPVGRALQLACQIARALAFAHGLGIVHRDVKPHNVLVDAGGTAKVTDFGIARSLDIDDALTETGTVLGTGHYISPEQASGERAGEASDQYSLGVVLYELLVGTVPYPGENLMSVAMRHLSEPVPSVRAARPDVPERVDAVVARALAKRPADRFPSTEALAAELEACLAEVGRPDEGGWAGETGVIPPPAPPGRAAYSPPPPRARPRRDRRRRLLAAALLVLAAVAGGLVALGLLLDDGVPGLPEGVGGGGGGETPVTLRAVTDHDPEGGDGEHPEAVPAATDGDPLTSWTTETYSSFSKSGVGIVVDAGNAVALTRLVVTTDTPGFTAEIRAGDRRQGPFEPVSEEQQVGRRTSFDLETDGERRFYVVWITDPNTTAHVNEVRGFASG
jgi:eukaryotic-like serine/threonine-protein kinase